MHAQQKNILITKTYNQLNRREEFSTEGITIYNP